MGCVVNGPGEAMDADLGIAGSKDFCVIFKKGEVVKKVPFDKAEEEFIKEIEEIAKKYGLKILEDGAQGTGEHVFGKSITDPCLGWEKTEKLIYELADKL